MFSDSDGNCMLDHFLKQHGLIRLSILSASRARIEKEPGFLSLSCGSYGSKLLHKLRTYVLRVIESLS